MRTTSTAFLFAVALTLGAHTASAGQPERKDFQIGKDIARAVNGCALLTIFDDINASLRDGVVVLTGKVTKPSKSADIARRVATVDGVRRVDNRIDTLPVSRFDDELRYKIARSIYGNANFWNYAVMANPPIHIVVERGRVTLTGVVQSDVDRAIARSLAVQTGAFSIKNDLKTSAEVRAMREDS